MREGWGGGRRGVHENWGDGGCEGVHVDSDKEAGLSAETCQSWLGSAQQVSKVNMVLNVHRNHEAY